LGLSLAHPPVPLKLTEFNVPANDMSEFDGMDFDEPMEVEAEAPSPRDEEEQAQPKAAAAAAATLETVKPEPQDPVLL